MCPENARVACFDDNKDAVWTVKEALKGSGHEVVVSETNGRYILENVEELLKKYRVQVVILDKNFDNFTWADKDGDDGFIDGKQILKKIRQCSPETKIVGFSSEEFPETDIDLGKKQAKKLSETITKL